MIFFSTIESILSIVVIILVGYLFTGKGWFNEEVGKTFSRIIMNLALPAYMMWNLMTTFSHELLLELAPGLLVPFASILVSYSMAYIIGKVLHIEKTRHGTFCSMFSLSNSIFIGLPVNLALFGEKSMPYVLLYYIANTSLFWTIGVNGIRSDGSTSKRKVKMIEVLRNVFSPPLLGFLLAILLILLGVSLPKFFIDACKYLGSMTTPLSMLFIGIAIYAVKLKNIKLSQDMIVIVLGRFVFSPLIVLGITYAMPLPILLKKVFIIQASLPVMTLTAVLAKAYKADAEYAAVMATVTTIAAMITIPIYMLIFQYYF